MSWGLSLEITHGNFCQTLSVKAVTKQPRFKGGKIDSASWWLRLLESLVARFLVYHMIIFQLLRQHWLGMRVINSLVMQPPKAWGIWSNLTFLRHPFDQRRVYSDNQSNWRDNLT